MSIPRGVYTFESVAFPGKMLNLYYNGSVANGQNVVLYSRDGSEEQKWKYIGAKLVTMRNESFALDRYHTSNASNQNNNNADVWAIADTDSADQIVQVRMISDNIAVIVLNDNKMVLKAVSSANGTNSGKTPQSSGNVYWSEPTENYDATQKWYITRVDVEDETDEPETEGQKLRLPVNGVNTLSASRTTSYSSSYYGQYGALHYGSDIACGNRTQLKGLGVGVVVGKGFNEKEGNFITVQYNNCIPCNGGNATDIVVRYFHMNEVVANIGQQVTTSTLLGYSGNTGAWAFGNYHIHIEVDTDVDYPNHTPSLSSSTQGGGLYAGNDSTGENPFDWFYTYDGQSKSRYWDSDETWVFPEDMENHLSY